MADLCWLKPFAGANFEIIAATVSLKRVRKESKVGGDGQLVVG